MSRKQRFFYILTLIASLTFIIIGQKLVQSNHSFYEDSTTYHKAKVSQIVNVNEESYSLGGDLTDIKNIQVEFYATILAGPDKGNTILATQTIDEIIVINPEQVQVGSKILIGNVSPEQWIFIDYYRTDTLILLVLTFLILIILFGFKKGMNTVLTLVLTCATIFLIFIPGILKGINIYILTISISSLIILMNFLLIQGPCKKTWCAILGNVGGVLISSILASITIKLLHLTGLVDSEMGLLVSLDANNPINLLALIWSGIVIGSLGAIMDIAITISSALQEIAENMEHKNFKTLLHSGLTIGKDALGTMTNTLILAYIGSSLATVLLLVASNKNLMFLFNMEMIAVEITQAVIGSIGIIVAIPLTAVIGAYIYLKNEKNLS